MVHVEVLICLDILGPGGFADPNITHPVLSLAGGAIADFLPHLASLAHLFVGPHRRAHAVWTKRRASVLPYDEFRAVVDAERGTAALGFSASTQPDGFWLRVYGERMQASANLFETRLTFTRVRPGPKPLVPLRNGLEEGKEDPPRGDRHPAAEVQARPGRVRGPVGAARPRLPRARRRRRRAGPAGGRARGEPARRGAEAAARGGAAVKALVTGAGGFLGRHVVAALLARGHEVRALVRPAADVSGLGWPSSVELVRADLRAARELEAAFDGVEVLRPPRRGRDRGRGRAVRRGGRRDRAAPRRDGAHHLPPRSSSRAASRSTTGARSTGTLDEDSPLEAGDALYERDGYTIAKAWQERVTRRLAGQHGWDLTVLRPGFIWGRDHAYLAALGQKIGKLHVVIGPFSRIPLTHVENCADLFAVASADPRARGRTFNVVDGEGPRIWTFLGEYLRGTGERGFRVPVPYWLAYGVVRLAYDHLFDKNPKLPHVLVPCRFEGRLKPLRFSNRRAREVLGWTPPLDHAACVARTYAPAEVTQLFSTPDAFRRTSPHTPQRRTLLAPDRRGSGVRRLTLQGPGA